MSMQGHMPKAATILLIFFAICGTGGLYAKDAPGKVTLLPHWIPQAQFAGYMMAEEKGFYKEAGLDLELLRGGPERPAFGCLVSGKATFCVEWLSSGIRKRSAGMRLVNLAQIVQRSALMLVARKADGITTPETLNGKRVGLWGGDFEIQPRAFFRKYNISPEIVPVYATANLFLKSAVQAVSAMWYNEYHTILNSGLNPEELTVFFFSDYGLNVPEDGLYCLEETFRKDPDLCVRFVQASLKGWLYAFEHKDEALNVVMNRAEAGHTGTNKAHQRWMLDRMQDLIMPGSDRSVLGRLNPDDYTKTGKILKEFGLTDSVPTFEEFHPGPNQW